MCVCVSQYVKFEVNIGIRAVRNEALYLSIQANDQDFYIFDWCRSSKDSFVVSMDRRKIVRSEVAGVPMRH